MSSVWITVYILTFAECVAPEGKSVCQPQEFELTFMDQDNCVTAMRQMIEVKDQMDNVIIDRERTKCRSTAMHVEAYPSVEAINAANEASSTWVAPSAVDERRQVVSESHVKRLSVLKSCEESQGVAPCKIGDIIVEEASGDRVEVWRRNGQ